MFSQKLGLNPDEACKDASRGAFLTTREDIILIDEERLFTYENEEFGKKYNEQYHHGKSQPTLDFAEIVVLLVVWPLYKVLEKTNRLYQEAMETTHELLSL